MALGCTTTISGTSIPIQFTSLHEKGGAWSEKNKLIAYDGAARDRFDCSVSLSGDTLIVGAHLHDVVGTDSGKAYAFRRSGGVWTEQQFIRSDAAAGDRFGHSVSVSGNTAIAGAWSSDDSGENSGSSYVFFRRGDQWIEQLKLTESDGTAGGFGFSVSVDGNTAIVSSHSSDADQSGATHVFQ